MKNKGVMLLCAIIGLLSSSARAGDIAGQWHAEFDTPIGQQKYLFTFQVNEGKLAAKATAEAGGEKREVEFKEPKFEGDTLSFVEMRKFQDNEVRIEYLGKVMGQEIKFTRKVGEFGTQEFVAKRGEPGAAAGSSPANGRAGEQPRRGPGFGGPIVLGPDDKPAFDDPPAGFSQRRDG